MYWIRMLGVGVGGGVGGGVWLCWPVRTGLLRSMGDRGKGVNRGSEHEKGAGRRIPTPLMSYPWFKDLSGRTVRANRTW